MCSCCKERQVMFVEDKKKGTERIASIAEKTIDSVRNKVKYGAKMAIDGKNYLANRVANTRHDPGEKSEKKPRQVSSEDIEKFKEAATQCLDRIDALYALKDDSPCGKWLRECAQWKAELPSLRTAGEAAQKVLGIYYQSGRIRDTLEKLDAFSRGEHIPSTPELVRIKGYNNYCSLLMQDVAALRRITIPNVEEAWADEKTVDALLREECSQMEFWKDIPEVRELCQRIDKGTIAPGAAEVNRIIPILERLKQPPQQPTQEMVLRRDSMRQQNKKLRDNIQEARDICNRLLPVLTEEWFQKLAPEIEDNPINQKDTDEVLQLYREALSGLIK